MWLFKKRRMDEPKTILTDPVVLEVHLKTDEAARRATRSTAKLNKIFEENGITLNIHVAAGGNNNGH